jgi:hypothetical protein
VSLEMTVKIQWQKEQISLLKQRIKRLEEALNTSWEIIANTSGGEWKQQHPQWQKAAARWRDNEFLPAMLGRKAKEAKP